MRLAFAVSLFFWSPDGGPSPPASRLSRFSIFTSPSPAPFRIQFMFPLLFLCQYLDSHFCLLHTDKGMHT